VIRCEPVGDTPDSAVECVFRIDRNVPHMHPDLGECLGVAYAHSMAPERPSAYTRFDLSKGTLSPEEVRHPDLPLALRGYDRERVDRLLARVADAYSLVWEQSQARQERLRSLEAELAAAKGEAEASARAVAELMQRSPTNGQLSQGVETLAALQSRLERAEAEREQALADLRQMSERASALAERMAALEDEQHAHPPQVEAADSSFTDDEAARLLVAAARAADDVRDAARARALRTLKKARELSALVHAQTEREREELTEMEERRQQGKRETEEILARASAEADRLNVEMDERRRQGEHEAEQIGAQARAEADRLNVEMDERRRQVEHEAEQIRAQARAEADRLNVEMEERRRQGEREAEEILARARAEADRIVTATEEERQRVRDLLTGALASLEAEAGAAGTRGDLVGDLSSRLDLSSNRPHETTEPTAS